MCVQVDFELTCATSLFLLFPSLSELHKSAIKIIIFTNGKLVKMAEVRNEQDEQTLFVRGISEEVDEEILFELFQNVSLRCTK